MSKSTLLPQTTQTKVKTVKKATKADLIEQIYEFSDEQIRKIIPLVLKADYLMDHKRDTLQEFVNTGLGILPTPISPVIQTVEEEEYDENEDNLIDLTSEGV